MKLLLSEDTVPLLAPLLLVSLIFFIPISASVKSILMICSVLALLATPLYRNLLSYAYNTAWARVTLVFFIYILCASFWSEAPVSMRITGIEKYSKIIFLPILAIGFINPKTRFWGLHSYLAVIFLSCILSVLKLHKLITLNTPDAGEVFYNHIATSYMIALGAFIAGVLMFQQKNSFSLKLSYILVFILSGYQILFINTSTTGYIIYIVLMSLLLITKLTLKKAVLSLMIFFSIIFLCYKCSATMHNKIHEMGHFVKSLHYNPNKRLLPDINLLQSKDKNSSLGYRAQFHRYSKSIFEKHPFFGIGTGGFSYQFFKEQPIPRWGKKLKEPHGQYWLILAEHGMIGFLLLWILLGCLFITSLKLRETKNIFWGVLLSFCLWSFSDTVFCYSTAGYLLTLFSALCFGELIERNMKLHPARVGSLKFAIPRTINGFYDLGILKEWSILD